MTADVPALPNFTWAVGVEDTFIGHPHPRTGRVLDEYLLTGHDREWRGDLGRIAELGVHAVRWGIPWYRVNPAPDVFDWAWTDEVFAELTRLGIRPIVDLMHYGTPLWLERSFVAPDYPDRIAEYAHRVAARYRASNAWYTPLNEPLVNAWYCGRSGLWPPNLRGERGYVRVLMALAAGMARTIRAVRDEDPTAVIVGVEAASHVRAAEPTLQPAADRSWHQQFLAHELAWGRVGDDHLMVRWLRANGASDDDLAALRSSGQGVDVMGVNIYPTLSCFTLTGAPEAPRRVRRYGTADDVAVILDAYHARFGVPVMVTETSDRARVARRARWMDASIAAVASTRAKGIPVVGYTWFPVFSHIDWRWRGGRLDLDRYWCHMGLWDVRRDGPDVLRRDETPLVRRYAGWVAGGAPTVAAGAPVVPGGPPVVPARA